MVRKCTWCSEIFGEKEPLEDKSITHGICEMCALQQTNKREWERRLRAQIAREVGADVKE